MATDTTLAAHEAELRMLADEIDACNARIEAVQRERRPLIARRNELEGLVAAHRRIAGMSQTEREAMASLLGVEAVRATTTVRPTS